MVLGFDEQKPYRIKSIYVHYLKDWVKLTLSQILLENNISQELTEVAFMNPKMNNQQRSVDY